MKRQENAEVPLALFAPYNEEVSLLGSWNNFKPQPMSKGEDGWWTISVPLEDGTYYYKFAVKSKSWFSPGEIKEIFDPYALSITHDEHENSVIVVKNGKRSWVEYEWKNDAHPLPNNDEIVIYEMHIGDFNRNQDPAKPGTFLSAIEKLDYIADLGFNCVELMPVKEFPGQGWGYTLKSLFGVENTYGTPEELCKFIDEAHARGIRVVIDGVYNHAHPDCALAQIDHDYWFYNPNPDPPEMQWGPKYNYQKFDENLKVFPARKYVIDSIKFWVEKFHLDGIRFDATRALKDFDMMHELSKAAFDMIDGRKPFITIAEHIPEDPAITGYPKGPMVAAWHESMGKQLQAIALGADRDGHHPHDMGRLLMLMDPNRNGFVSGNHFVNFIVSHDQVRLIHQLGETAKLFDEAAFRRLRLVAALLIISPGLPMIWMGSEFGFSADKSLDPRPLDWSLLQHDNNRGLNDWYKKLLHIRKDNDAIRSDQFEGLLVDQERQLIAIKRWNEAGNVVVMVANLKDEPSGDFTIESAGLEDGKWVESLYDYDIEVNDGKLTDQLDASGVKIFIKQ